MEFEGIVTASPCSTGLPVVLLAYFMLWTDIDTELTRGEYVGIVNYKTQEITAKEVVKTKKTSVTRKSEKEAIADAKMLAKQIEKSEKHSARIYSSNEITYIKQYHFFNGFFIGLIVGMVVLVLSK